MTGGEPMSFEAFRKSFYYGDHADMQFKFLAAMDDDAGADVVAEVLARVGEALDTGDLTGVRDAVYAAQVAAYQVAGDPVVEDAPFTPLRAPLHDLRLAVMSAGGVFPIDDDPMGPDGPTQQESLALINDFLRGSPTLSVIPTDTPDSALTARHPGYDARNATRAPSSRSRCCANWRPRAAWVWPGSITPSPGPLPKSGCAPKWRRSGRGACSPTASTPACWSQLDRSATSRSDSSRAPSRRQEPPRWRCSSAPSHTSPAECGCHGCWSPHT